MQQTISTEQIQSQMREVIEKAENALEQGARFFEEQGLNREKAYAFFEAQFGEQSSIQAREAFAADMLAVEQEVREEMARQANASGAPAQARRPRDMV